MIEYIVGETRVAGIRDALISPNTKFENASASIDIDKLLLMVE